MSCVHPCVPGTVLDSFHVLCHSVLGKLGQGGRGCRSPVTDEDNEEHINRFRVKAKVIASECTTGIRPQF